MEPYLLLILGSIGVNYLIHLHLKRRKDLPVLISGIALNLLAIAYFKYANFFVDTMNGLAGTGFSIGDIALPLAISFFTFQQIAFLVETYRGQVLETGLAKYVLFVTFFPQLIAGPIVMQRETVPQFKMSVFQSKLALNLSIGLTLFVIGLFKKLVLADGIAPYATNVFALADGGADIPLSMAWSGALAYTFQIYFDFSGYCDMALGLARCFGIRLPINFNSPYKATSIVDFWRRWHLTLSHFLRDYLYIPLGGNRGTKTRRYANLIITMLLGGLWHGASWTFVVWGGLHGCYLMINHAWTTARENRGLEPGSGGAAYRVFAQTLTLLAVVVAWVFFRAETFAGAASILAGMVGLNGLDLARNAPAEMTRAAAGVAESFFWFVPLALIALVSNAISTARYRPTLDYRKELGRGRRWRRPLDWQPTAVWGFALSAIAIIGVSQMYRLGDLSEFIYYNF